MNDDGMRSDLAGGIPDAGGSVRSVLMAATLLGTAVGLQAMLSLCFLPVKADPAIPSSLMTIGRGWFRPEQDLKIYILGSAATLLLTLILGAVQRSRLRGVAPDRVVEDAAQFAGSMNLLAGLSSLAFLLVLGVVLTCRGMVNRGAGGSVIMSLSGYSRLTQPFLLLPAVAALALALRGVRLPRAGRFGGFPGGPPGDEVPMPPGGPGWSFAGGLWALGIAAGVVLLFLIPDARVPAGVCFTRDQYPFHHWDYYMMAPAVAYRDGLALGPGAYVQYGVGHPMVVNWLSPLSRLSYGNLYFLASVYGSLYFLGLAGLLRIWHGSWPWAAVGVLVAAYLQAFQGVEEGLTTWTTPSSSVLRYSMDVWFFGALWMHLKTGRPAWAALAGLTVGLGLLLGFDTGVYLVVVLGFYLGVRLLFGPSGRLEAGLGLPGELGTAALASAACLAVTVAGIAAATGRAPWAFDRELFGSLFESLLVYSGGMSCLPISDVPGPGQCQFLVVAGTYLALLGWLGSSLIGPGADRRQVFRGCVSAYGLGTLMLFVQRSHPFNLYHGIIPFAILAVDGMHAAVDRLARPGWRGACTAVLGAGALAVLLADPNLRDYPGVIQSALASPAEPGVEFPSLGVSVRPATPKLRAFAGDFERLTSRLARAREAGLKVVVLDEAETMFELASGVPPADRYYPLFANLITREIGRAHV